MFQSEVERQREEGERQFQDRLAEGRLQAEGNFTQQVTGFIHKRCTLGGPDLHNIQPCKLLFCTVMYGYHMDQNHKKNNL